MITRMVLAAATVAFTSSIDDAEARRGGRFVSSYSRGIPHSGAAKKSYGPDVLTAQQLTDCMKRADSLDGESNALEADRSMLKAKVDLIDTRQSEMERMQRSLDRYSQSSVDRFNAQVQRHNALIGEAKASQAMFNAKIDQHNQVVDNYNEACAKPYYADDLEAAKRAIGLD